MKTFTLKLFNLFNSLSKQSAGDVMEDKILNSLLERCMDRYDMVLRWTSITVGVFLVFHLFIFIPFIIADKKLSDVEARLRNLQDTQKIVEGVSDDLTKLSEMSIKNLKSQSDELYGNLRNSFDKLSEYVENIRTEKKLQEIQTFIEKSNDNSDVRTILDRIQSNSNIRSLYSHVDMQESIQSLQSVNKGYLQNAQNKTAANSFNFEEGLKEQISSAKSVDEIRDLLLPTIEKDIIAPQFKAFNLAWQREIFPEMKSFSSKIQKRLENANTHDKSKNPPWGSILITLEDSMNYAEKIKFSPPENRFWWVTAKGKEDTLSDINFDFRRDFTQLVSIDKISDELSTTISQQQNAETNLRNDLESIKNSFEKFMEHQSGQIIGLPKQFGGIPIDLDSLILCYPFLIGPMLASFAVWQTRRLSDLITAIDIAKKHDKSNRNTLSKSFLSFIGVTAAGWLWLGISFWQLTAWHTLTYLSSVAMILLSGGVMTAAFIYRWRTIKRML